MTALAGYWAGGDESASACAAILDAQARYGDREPCFWSDPPLSLGIRPHSTLMAGGAAHEPVVSNDGRWVLLADLRLDNRDALSATLSFGEDLARLDDGAFALRAIEKAGVGIISRFVGDFALVLWDAATQKLLLARDALGQRPLFYHQGADFFACASMPSGLFTLPQIPRSPDLDRAAAFLALEAEDGSATMFEAIERVEPGQTVTIDRDRTLHRQSFWRPDLTPVSLPSDDHYVAELREQLDRAVARRLRGGGELVGAHLSAGLDSSASATTAARLIARQNRRLVAFTAVPRTGYEGPTPFGRLGDEGELAAMTAAMHPNIDHVFITSSGHNPIADLDENFDLFARPIPNLSNNGWWNAIADEAKSRGIGVMLTGQAGNWSISHGGYETLPFLLSKGRLRRFVSVARGLRRHGFSARALVYGSLVPLLPDRLVGAIMRGRGHRPSPRGKRRPTKSRVRAHHDSPGARLAVIRGMDLGAFYKGMLAGWGLDFRDPTADRDLVEYCLRVPVDQYLLHGRPRSLAIRALADRVPAALLDERRKGFQAPDWHEDLSPALADIEAELDRIAAVPEAAALIDVPAMKSLVAGWDKADPHNKTTLGLYRGTLMRSLSVGHFLRRANGP